MLVKTREWDIRITTQMIDFYKKIKEEGAYFYKLNILNSRKIIELLCDAYEISYPESIRVNVYFLRKNNCNACYFNNTSEIYLYPRTHILTPIHEFYHHLEIMSGGKYDSSDDKNYASVFSHKLYDELRTQVYGKKFKKNSKFISMIV